MVLPIHDQNPVRRTPVVTYTIIAVNVVAFMLEPIHHMQLTRHGVSAPTLCEQVRFFDHYAAIPHELTTGHAFPHAYINQLGQTVCQDDFTNKQPALSVLYSMFLHGSWLHLLGNMLFLYVFGNNVEDRFGRIRFTVFYLAGGYAATYGFALGFPNSNTTLVGASGAIAAVLGAYLVLSPRARVLALVPFLLFLPLRLPAWLVLGSWFLLQWWYAAGGAIVQGSGVAYLAHVVGFAFGLVVTVALRGTLRPALPYAGYTRRIDRVPR